MLEIITPHLTEKTYKLAKELNVYVFKVNKTLNIAQIKDILQKQYKIEIIDVRTLVAKGKKARSIRINSPYRKRVVGKRSDIKKAYVTLKQGDTIPVFVDASSDQAS